MKKSGFLLSLACLTFLSGITQAAAQNSLSEPAIRKFYAESQAALKYPFEQHVAYLQKSMTESYEGTNSTVVTAPEQAPIPATETQSKAEIIANVQANYDAIKNATVKEEIQSIQISPDGKSATVRAKTDIKNLSIPTPPGSPKVSADTASTCTDKIVLSPEGIVQIDRSDCNGKVTLTLK